AAMTDVKVPEKTVELSLVIPTFDEKDNIPVLIGQVRAALVGIPYEIIVADDDSPDGTWQVAEACAKHAPEVRVLRRMHSRGLSGAVVDGFNIARGRFLGVMDADLSHDPKILPLMLEAVRNGADFAVGSRRVAGGGADKWPWFRRLYSNVGTLFAKAFLNVPMADPMSGYFMTRRELFEEVRPGLNPKGYKILMELVVRSGTISIREIPFIFRDRKQGQSKLTSRVAGKYLEMLWDLRVYAGLLSRIRRTYHTGRYRKVRGFLGEGRTLDIGCGRPCECMQDQVFLRFLGRQDSAGLDIRDIKGPYKFLRGSVASMPFADGEFDNVVAMEIIEHITDVPAALAEIKRVLKPGGVLVMTTPDNSLLWMIIWRVWSATAGRMWRHDHKVSFTCGEWKKLLDERFEVADMRRHWRFDLIFRCMPRTGGKP
ncbi:MAG: glycosyltransferase, partial [bacterium]